MGTNIELYRAYITASKEHHTCSECLCQKCAKFPKECRSCYPDCNTFVIDCAKFIEKKTEAKND